MPPSAAPPRPFRAAGSTEALRIGALGINLWAVSLLLPVVHGGVRDLVDSSLVPLPLLALAIGVTAIASNGRASMRSVAVAALLFLFPIALAAAIAWRADLSDRDAWGALGLFVSALSLLAYGGVAAEACSRPLALRTSSAESLPSPLALHDPALRSWLRRGIIGGTTVGALLVAVVAPALGSRATLVGEWGDAADEATVLACIVGATAASIGLAGLLGPSLRAPRAQEIPGARRTGVRIAFSGALAVAAVAAYLVLRHFDAR